MPPTEQSLTVRQGVVLVARAISIFFLFWVVVNLLELPGYLAALVHYHAHGDGPSNGTYYTYWTSRYVGYVGGALLRATSEIWLASYFYRCGAKVQRFFLAGLEEAPNGTGVR